MPRPRFDRLEPARREAIFDAAAAEFGEHGFERASYNRIIERAGLSKGAMYYYFDDKRDLFVTVVADSVGRLLDVLEPVGKVDGIAAFWARLGTIFESTWSAMMGQPRVATLMPALLDPRNTVDVPEAMRTMNERVGSWIREFLGQGRAVGAVRDDLPDELLMALTFSVGEAMDRWVAQRFIADDSPTTTPSRPTEQTIQTMVDLMRRLLAPA